MNTDRPSCYSRIRNAGKTAGEIAANNREINRTNITAFIARALNRAGASAVDLEFGLRMREAKVTPLGNIVLDFDGGLALVLASETVSRDIANCN